MTTMQDRLASYGDLPTPREETLHSSESTLEVVDCERSEGGPRTDASRHGRDSTTLLGRASSGQKGTLARDAEAGRSGVSELDVDTENTARVWDGLIRNLSTLMKAAQAPSRNSEDTNNSELSDDDWGPDETVGWCSASRVPCCHRVGMCYYCFLLVFGCFFFVFPLFMKWMITSPMPNQYWNERYPEFPVLVQQDFMTEGRARENVITVTDIPRTWSGCNHTCSTYGGSTRASSEMNFEVEMTFNAPEYEHTAYPVLFASNDFSSWWLAADKRHAEPQPYFAEHTDQGEYSYVTETCTRPPEVKYGEEELVVPEDSFASAATYILVCVTWHPDKVEWHRENTALTAADLAERCDAVGGVCGVPCGANPGAAELPGCSSGILNVTSGAVAGVSLAGASFAGDVSVRACQPGPDGIVDEGKCNTYTSPMSQWPCHQCQNDTVNESLVYDSLPRMEVTLENAPVGGANGLNAGATPRAFFMTSPLDPSTQQPLGMQAGRLWKKLYDPMYYPLPQVVTGDEVTEEEDEEGEGRRLMSQEEPEEEPRRLAQPTASPTPAPWPIVDADRHTMGWARKNSVTLKPSWCFGERGPLYIVACAVNKSTYESGFVMGDGQEIAPPPFNDRCIAVSGKCGYACMEQQSPAIQHCDASGNIPMSELIKEFEPPTNDGPVVGMFVWTLLLGFAVKVLTYTPGLFMPYKHAQHYTARQTSKFKYIAVCVPSGGETKACVLRNIVGAVSGLPTGCQCPFHVVFADEGHRHPQKVMFRALTRVLDAVPAVPMTTGSMPMARVKSSVVSARNSVGTTRSGVAASKSSRSIRTMSCRAIKEENLKLFLRHWTEQTRAFRLATCNTDQMAKKAEKLRAGLLQAEEAADGPRDKDLLRKDEAAKKEIKSLEDMIDALCGKNALKLLQAKYGWPKADSEEGREVRELEEAIQGLRNELTAGEKQTAAPSGTLDGPQPASADDCEDHSWYPPHAAASGVSDEDAAAQARTALYTMHYVARAKPDEDERTLKVQHVARGGWYYKVPFDEAKRQKKSWLEWRRDIYEFQDGDYDVNKILVPVRTSRGKAGGLNFVENYLFQYHLREPTQATSLDPVRFKPALFSIADARHQFQPDFFHVTIPFFFNKGGDEVNPRVAFTQCPQYFPEMPDDDDYLDTNNSNFFRLNCMLRNCCGGVSSCGTNGTWLIRDRRAGVKGHDSIWELDSQHRMRAGFTQMLEHRFFHESCKVEDTASSLDRVVKGKYSQYINRKLSYGMAKDPVDYLAAVQRWAEGGVVLSLQTFLSCKEGIHMIWATFFCFILFIFSLGNMLFGYGSQGAISHISQAVFGDQRLLVHARDAAAAQADVCVEAELASAEHRDAYAEVFLEVEAWIVTVFIGVMVVMLITMVSNVIHHCTCCGRRRKFRRTRFPTSPSQWARLMITMDNLTYFLWFWTAFFWVGFNYYTVYGKKYYHFDAMGMVLFSWLLQVLSWSMIISSSSRYNKDQGMQANEVFFLSLTNIWRTTQMFYITAPLTVYSIIMGFSDYFKNKMFGVDISYWVGGDRGAVSKGITQWWTLMLVAGTILTWMFFITGWVAVDPGAALIVTFIGLDVLHPCAFLWLGTAPEALPRPPAKGSCPAWRRCIKRWCRLMVCSSWYRNILRFLIFHPRVSMTIKWIGPLQHVMLPVLTWFMPEMGVNQALLLLASVK